MVGLRHNSQPPHQNPALVGYAVGAASQEPRKAHGLQAAFDSAQEASLAEAPVAERKRIILRTLSLQVHADGR